MLAEGHQATKHSDFIQNPLQPLPGAAEWADGLTVPSEVSYTITATDFSIENSGEGALELLSN